MDAQGSEGDLETSGSFPKFTVIRLFLQSAAYLPITGEDLRQIMNQRPGQKPMAICQQ